mmetsp:Transcript_10324/g.22780  ORF Transcript_10324/g.22780 Transcript_10324/m.22780 type:complete len:514 (-) Transcript_10324:187-1728(-)
MNLDEVDPHWRDKMSAGQEKTQNWRVGDRIHAVWQGNSCYYPATVVEILPQKRVVVVTWDDADDSFREVPFSLVLDLAEESSPWTRERIDEAAIVKDTAYKGRCLFTANALDPGKVIFIEKPLLVSLPSMSQNLWNFLNKLHEEQALQLGTVTFHFAALLSELFLDKKAIQIIRDKFVPEPEEAPGDDVLRILAGIKANPELAKELKVKERNFDPHHLQRLTSAWRYNSFGHHKEDGLVLYNRISMCAHSCDPSCCWSYGEQDSFVLRARVGLKEGDELTISYLQDEDLLKSTNVRQQKLLNWRFTCMCSRCKLQVDLGRGFRCRKCRVGTLYATVQNTLEPCTVCTTEASIEDIKMLTRLEDEYVVRLDNTDKTDVPDIERVFKAAMDLFEHHWIVYVLDTMLWEAYKEKQPIEAIEHQRRRIAFHEHYFNRPTFILAWCHEELGDAVNNQTPNRKWQSNLEYSRAYQMLSILCGLGHQYTSSPYQKLLHNAESQQESTTTPERTTGGARVA